MGFEQSSENDVRFGVFVKVKNCCFIQSHFFSLALKSICDLDQSTKTLIFKYQKL